MKADFDKIKNATLEEHIRLRPGMYLGSSDSKGLVYMISESLFSIYKLLSKQDIFFHITISKAYGFELVVKSQSNIFFEEIDFVFPSESQNKGVVNLRHRFVLLALRALSKEWSVDRKKGELKVVSKLESSLFEEEVNLKSLSKDFELISILYPNVKILLTDEREEFAQQVFHDNPRGLESLWVGSSEKFIDVKKDFGTYSVEIKVSLFNVKSKKITFVNRVKNRKHSGSGSLLRGIEKGLVNSFKNYIDQENTEDLVFKKKKFLKGLKVLASISGEDFIYQGSHRIFGLDEPEKEKEIAQFVQEVSIMKLKNDNTNSFYFPFIKKSRLKNARIKAVQKDDQKRTN